MDLRDTLQTPPALTVDNTIFGWLWHNAPPSHPYTHLSIIYTGFHYNNTYNITPQLGISKDPYETLLVITCNPWTKKEMAKSAVVMYVVAGVWVCLAKHLDYSLLGPTDLIGEKWSETRSTIQPALPFRAVPGPVHQLPQDATPLDFFSLFWETAFFQRLADETNLYARQKIELKPDKKWYPTTADEMRAFIGVNIIMGIDKKPTIYQYWLTDPFLGNPGIQSTFSRDRFEALCRLPPPTRL